MNIKKALPVILLVILAIIAICIRRCSSTSGRVDTTNASKVDNRRNTTKPRGQTRTNSNETTDRGGLDRKAKDIFFTKHVKCRMKCRHITQQEVKDILAKGEINYNKSDLQDPRGATYAVEGITRDRQRVRIIFAPKQAHLTVVTVIDLEVEYECNCT